MGPFTWKEDDPSVRIILEGSFGLHAKTRLLDELSVGLHAGFVFSAVAKQDGQRQ